MNWHLLVLSDQTILIMGFTSISEQGWTLLLIISYLCLWFLDRISNDLNDLALRLKRRSNFIIQVTPPNKKFHHSLASE
jgi:hypothetical protein